MPKLSFCGVFIQHYDFNAQQKSCESVPNKELEIYAIILEEGLKPLLLLFL